MIPTKTTRRTNALNGGNDATPGAYRMADSVPSRATLADWLLQDDGKRLDERGLIVAFVLAFILIGSYAGLWGDGAEHDYNGPDEAYHVSRGHIVDMGGAR